MNSKLGQYGRWTYRGAWALEITAATIGLATGLFLGWQAAIDGESAGVADFVLASLPLFMVALAELTKIPIATLLFAVGWIWKPIVLLFLFALAFITFETVFTGMERATTLRQLKYQRMLEQISSTKVELEALEKQANQLSNPVQVENAQKQVRTLEDQYQIARNRVLQEIDQLEGEMRVPPEQLARYNDLKSKSESREIALRELKNERQAELTQRMEAFERQRDSYNERIKAAREAGGSDVAVRRWEQEQAALKSPFREVDQRFGAKILAAEQTAQSARDAFEQFSSTLATTGSDADKAAREERVAELRNLEKTWGARIDEAVRLLSVALGTEDGRSEALAKAQQELQDTRAALSQLEADRIPMARLDQVRRIAARFYGTEPENVTVEQAGVVSLVWFGSLAGLAALAGPATAMVALALQRIGERPDRVGPGPFGRSLRRALVAWRWRRKQTVLVDRPVEVPVDREVLVEVQVEKVIKEILYVPILTDDPDMVRRALASDLPPEVADLVSIRAKGLGVGSAA